MENALLDASKMAGAFADHELREADAFMLAKGQSHCNLVTGPVNVAHGDKRTPLNSYDLRVHPHVNLGPPLCLRRARQLRGRDTDTDCAFNRWEKIDEITRLHLPRERSEGGPASNYMVRKLTDQAYGPYNYDAKPLEA